VFLQVSAPELGARSPPWLIYDSAVGRILRKLKGLSLRSLNRGDQTAEGESRLENTDALSATGGHSMDPQGAGHQGAPTDWVRSDDGRPRH